MVPPRSWPRATGGVERGSAANSRRLGHRTGQLVLESGAGVCLGTVRHQPEPEQLPKLSASAGIRLQTSQETTAQGGRDETGGLCCGIRGPGGGVAGDRSQDILCRRGPFPCRRGTAGQVGAERGTGAGGLDQSQLRREGQLLLGGVPGDRGGGVDGCFGRLSRRGTATTKRRLPS